MQKNYSILRCVMLFLLITLLEPLIELGYLFLHNFIFFHIAGVEFGGVSIASLLGFLAGFRLNNLYIEQYVLMLPISALFALFVSCACYFRIKIGLFFWIKASLYILLLIIFALLIFDYRLLHIITFEMLSSFVISALYWLNSTGLIWLLLLYFRLI